MSNKFLQSKKKDKILLLAILVFTSILFLGVKNFNFVNWDDDENIGTDSSFTKLSVENFTKHYQKDRYKALAIWSFMLEYQFFGHNPKYYHLDNLILHLLNVVFVFILIKRLVPKNRFAPLIVSVFFAVHPAFVEPIAWVTGRKDLLFVLFSLLSILSYLKFLKIEKQHLKYLMFGLTGLLVYLASLSKIQAIALPFVFFLIDWLEYRKFSFSSLLEKLIIFLLIVDLFKIILIILLFVIVVKVYKPMFAIMKKNIWAKIISSIVLFFIILFLKTYVKEALCHYMSYKSALVLSEVFLWLGYFLILFLMFFQEISKKIRLFFTKLFPHRNYNILIIALIAIALIAVFQHEYIIKYFPRLWNIDAGHPSYFNFAERFLLLGSSLLYYLSRFFLLKSQDPMIPYPSRLADGSLPNYMFFDLGIILLIMGISLYVLIKYFRKNRIVWFGVLFFLINIGVVLHIIPIEGRVLAADRYTYLAYIGLFLIMALIADYFIEKKRGKIISGIIGLSVIFMSYTTYQDKNTWKNSFTLWEKALKVNPKNHFAMYSLALANSTEANDIDNAEKLLDKAINLKEDFMYYNNRGRIHYAKGNYTLALDDFDKSILLDSANSAAYNNRGAVRQQFCDFIGALSDYKKAVELNPDYQDALNNIKRVENLLSIDSVLFEKSENKAISEVDILNFVLYISEKMLNTGQKPKAILYLEQAIKVIPNNYEIYERLALIYHLNEEFSEAKDVYNQGLDKLGKNESLLLGRGLLNIQIGDTVSACKDFKQSAELGNDRAKMLEQEFCGDTLSVKRVLSF
ncbi:MAG TPA: hypothetical protein PLC87_08465 [Bacteroidales bacterium]|nr:hypothetical protein [Bacteroidales bacterium]HOL98827.1 hypothetical protein [Bacteroidales bacterium]HUM32933.1 hypothetical protein [Bacteroidales bacterium]